MITERGYAQLKNTLECGVDDMTFRAYVLLACEEGDMGVAQLMWRCIFDTDEQVWYLPIID